MRALSRFCVDTRRCTSETRTGAYSRDMPGTPRRLTRRGKSSRTPVVDALRGRLPRQNQVPAAAAGRAAADEHAVAACPVVTSLPEYPASSSEDEPGISDTGISETAISTPAAATACASLVPPEHTSRDGFVLQPPARPPALAPACPGAPRLHRHCPVVAGRGLDSGGHDTASSRTWRFASNPSAAAAAAAPRREFGRSRAGPGSEDAAGHRPHLNPCMQALAPCVCVRLPAGVCLLGAVCLLGS